MCQTWKSSLVVNKSCWAPVGLVYGREVVGIHETSNRTRGARVLAGWGRVGSPVRAAAGPQTVVRMWLSAILGAWIAGCCLLGR